MYTNLLERPSGAPSAIPEVGMLADYDIIIINSSGGKDSQTMLRLVAQRAAAEGVSDRVTVVHADLGRVEWAGTKDLARRQAEHYGLPFVAIARPQGDLLAQIEARGMFPSSAARYCTSDHKRGQIRKVMTALVTQARLGRPARVLNCMGMRAQESSARAKRKPFSYDKGASGKGTVRQVFEWLPIHDWTADRVWADIRESGVEHHPAYDLGMPRLSCCFCVLASRSALVLAAQHNTELAQEYLDVEVRIGHRFQQHLSMAQIIEEARALSGPITVSDWSA